MSNYYVNKFVVEPRRVWIVLVSALVPFLLYPHGNKDAAEVWLRWHGTILQVFGGGLVFRGLNETAKLFERPTFWDQVLSWGSSLRRPRAVSGRVSVTISPMGIAATGHVGQPTITSAERTLETRIIRMEQELVATNRRLDELRNVHDGRFEQFNKRLDSELAKQSSENAKTKELMLKQIPDGLPDGYMGLAVVLIGTIYSGLTELARMFY